jgi:hypothetical protein
MNVAALRSFIALAAASALLAGSALLVRRQRNTGSRLLLLATICFVVVALSHVFEALSILPAAGWGRPRSVGHYIDLIAAVLGLSLAVAGMAVRFAYGRAA